MENELNNSKAYYTLAIDIEKTIKLNPHNRQINAIKYLDSKYSTFQKLTEQSNPMSNKFVDMLAHVPEVKKTLWRKKTDDDTSSLESNIDEFKAEA